MSRSTNSNFTAGRFEVEINGPHPCWFRVKYNGEELYGIRHDELRDLQFALERAAAEARRRLGKDASEMD